MVGSVTAEKTLPQLKAFLEQGGAVLAIGSSTDIAYHLNLPLSDALTETGEDGKPVSLPMTKYFVPGSVLRVRVDNTQPAAHGLPEEVDVFFNRSPVFRLAAGANGPGLETVAWFDSDAPLRSGWAMGQHFLKDGLAVVEARIGAGRLFLFGPEITFRAQTHGTLKFLFNGIAYGSAEEEPSASLPR
jgi:hypothetical protein